MRLLLVSSLIVGGLFGQTANQLRAPQAIGFYTSYGANNDSTALSAAATWLGFGFVAQTAKTLNTVTIYCSAIAGSLGSTDTDISLYTDSAGVPNTQTEHHGGQCTSAATLTVSGFTTTLTAGSMNWIVIKNLNGTPASNNFTVAYTSVGAQASGVPFSATGSQNSTALYGWLAKTSANSGTSWTTPSVAGIGMRLGYSDSTNDGFIITTTTRPGSGASGDRATGKQEAGVVFSLPSNVKYNVIGIGMQLTKVSTPGNLQFRLYNGTTLLATTAAVTAANVTTGNPGDWYFAYFSAKQTLDPSTMTTIRVTMEDATSGDASTLGYNGMLFTVPNDATSLALKPMNGTLKKTITTDNTGAPPVFTDTTTQFFSFALLLDSNGEFTSAGGSCAVPSCPITQ